MLRHTYIQQRRFALLQKLTSNERENRKQDDRRLVVGEEIMQLAEFAEGTIVLLVLVNGAVRIRDYRLRERCDTQLGVLDLNILHIRTDALRLACPQRTGKMEEI